MFSYTGIAYLFGFFAIGLMSYRFFRYWRQEKTTISKLFFLVLAPAVIFFFNTAIGGLFFVNNPSVLKWVAIISIFIQSFNFTAVIYLIFYLKFPKISPWLGAVPIFLIGLISTIMAILNPFYPYIDHSGSINWNINPIVNIPRAFLFLVTFFPLIIILIQQIKSSDPLIKIKAFFLSIMAGLGIIIGILDFFHQSIFELSALSTDIVLGVFSIIVFIIVLLPQKYLF